MMIYKNKIETIDQMLALCDICLFMQKVGLGEFNLFKQESANVMMVARFIEVDIGSLKYESYGRKS